MAVNRYYSSTAVDTTLASSMTGSATTFTVSSTQGFPTSYPYTLAIDYDTSSEELVNVVGASGTTLTVGTTVGVASTTGRAVDGTQGGTGVSHNAGAAVKHVISGRDMREAQEHIAATNGAHGLGTISNIVYTSGTGNVSTTMLASSAVTTAKILDGNVTTAKLADSAVTSAKIADGTIATADIADGAVTSAKIADLGIATGDIADGAITSAKIADGAIVNADINASAAIDWTKLAVSSTVNATEVGYLDGVTSAIQTQLNNLIPKGTVNPFAGSSAPSGWLLCSGQAVSRTTYAALFAVIGTTYGVGDNTTTFNVPDLRGRTIAGLDNIGGTDAGRLSWQNVLGTVGAASTTTDDGTQTVTLTSAQSGLPAHQHGVGTLGINGGDHYHSFTTYKDGSNTHDHADNAGGTSPSQSAGAGSGSSSVTTSTDGHSHGISGSVALNTAAPASQAHNNMQPTMLLNYIIKY